VVLALVGCDAIDDLRDHPWKTESDVRALVEVVRDGQRIPPEQIALGPDGLRMLHRTDVFRAREYSVRGHETHRQCVSRSQGSDKVDEIVHCDSLSVGNSGHKLTATDLAGGAIPFLSAKQAVLHVLHRSSPMAPVVYEVDPTLRTLPVIAESTFDGLDRYWAKYWAHCKGCLGLVWIEVTYQGSRYCTRPLSPAVEGQSFRVQVDLNADRIQASPIEQQMDVPPCGDRSYFQALWLDDDRTANQINFR
jgi:hypothetical protein